MSTRAAALALCFATAVRAAAPPAAAPGPPTAPHPAPPAAVMSAGAALYVSRCAVCHDHPSGRIPPKVFIATTRTAEDVIDTLTSGVMRMQAAGLKPQEIRALAIYLTGREPAPRAAVDANLCHRKPDVHLTDEDWRSWGGDLANLRFQPQGLKAAQVPRLKLRWTFAYPGESTF